MAMRQQYLRLVDPVCHGYLSHYGEKEGTRLIKEKNIYQYWEERKRIFFENSNSENIYGEEYGDDFLE